jgi:hypothetical protein
MDVIPAKLAFDAEPAFINCITVRGGNPDNTVILNTDFQSATDSAIGTNRSHFLQFPFTSRRAPAFLYQCPGRTRSHALATKNTVALLQGPVIRGSYFTVKAAMSEVNGFNELDIIAGGNAPSAKDAFIVIP